MKKENFDNLLQSVREMQAVRAGKLKPARVTRLTPEHPRAVRSRLGMTQAEFATMLGVPVGTLRNWEQGHREPAGAAKALLRVAAKYPGMVRRALAAA
jgi:putative transcriptional regulator